MTLRLPPSPGQGLTSSAPSPRCGRSVPLGGRESGVGALRWPHPTRCLHILVGSGPRPVPGKAVSGGVLCPSEGLASWNGCQRLGIEVRSLNTSPLLNEQGALPGQSFFIDMTCFFLHFVKETDCGEQNAAVGAEGKAGGQLGGCCSCSGKRRREPARGGGCWRQERFQRYQGGICDRTWPASGYG